MKLEVAVVSSTKLDTVSLKLIPTEFSLLNCIFELGTSKLLPKFIEDVFSKFPKLDIGVKNGVENSEWTL